jgi:hypothetical protein
MFRNLKSILRQALCDKFTNLQHHPRRGYEIAFETLRYRMASVGIPITKNEQKLCHYRDLHLGQRAFIIGNGPSLKNTDLSLLKNEITFGVNSIFLNIQQFLPTYYVLEDYLVAEDRSKEIASMKGPIKFWGNYLKYCMPDNSDVVWCNVRVLYDNYPGFPNFSTNAIRELWTGGTVSYLCMQLAYFMGVSTVYLIGFDHSYTIPKDVIVIDGDIISNSEDPNHFSADYFGKGYRWHDPQVDRMETAYCKAKLYFEKSGRKIYNATTGGKLEVFERVDYYSLFV